MSERRAEATRFDVAVVGGGLAGGVSAWHLARRGLNVALFEREKGGHNKVCGEFLSGEGVPFLDRIGVDVRKLGATPIRRFRLHGPKRSFEAKLPIPALGISRKVLDEAVLEQVENSGARVFRGVLVRELVEGLDSPAGTFLLETSMGDVRSHRLIVATGKHEFKTVHQRVGRDSGYVGFKMHLRLKPSAMRKLSDHCDLFVFEHGYGGLAPIEDGKVNFCFLIERKALKSIGTDWHALASHVAHHNWDASHYLDGAEPLFRNFSTIATVPYGFIRRDPPAHGVFCVGDQMAVIPSLTGDGMTIALMTGSRAADAIADAERPGRLQPSTLAFSYQREMRKTLRSQVDAGYQMHRLFRSPHLTDLATYAARFSPALFDFVFMRTRCHVSADEDNTPLSGGSEAQVSLNVAPGHQDS